MKAPKKYKQILQEFWSGDSIPLTSENAEARLGQILCLKRISKAEGFTTINDMILSTKNKPKVYRSKYIEIK
jgi:hypothetical protein